MFDDAGIGEIIADAISETIEANGRINRLLVK